MTIVFFDREEQRVREVREIERRAMTRLCGVRLDAQCCTPGDAAARHPAGARWGIVAPGNSFGLMDGGLDAAIAQALPEVEALVRSEIETVYFGELPVGAAVTVVTSTWDAALDGLYVIYAPTMQVPMTIRGTANVYYAMLAALRCAHTEQLDTLYVPLMGAGTGALQVDESMTQMLEAVQNYIARGLVEISWEYARSMHNLWHRLTGVPYDEGEAAGDD